LASVYSEEETIFSRKNSQNPLSVRRKAEWNRRQAPWPFREYAHETNDVGANWLVRKRIRGGGAEEVASLADYDFGFKRQSAA
jgi:hypothetical protein